MAKPESGKRIKPADRKPAPAARGGSLQNLAREILGRSKARQRADRKPAPAAAALPAAAASVRDLVFDPKNARKHSDRNLAVITGSISEVGAARSIVIDEKNVVLAGNATARSAAAAGVTKLKIIDTDGSTLIAVRRRGLTDVEKVRLALADNRASELASWDPEVLEQLQASGVSLEGLFSEDEMLDMLSGRSREGLTDPDELPLMRPTSIERGQLFGLGAHRLLCGDAEVPGDVAQLLGAAKPRLMVTDPPYGVQYAPAWRREAGVNNSDRMGAVKNDDRADWSAAWKLFPGSVAYVWHAGVFASVVEASLKSADFGLRSQIIWRKPRLVLSRGHYHWQHEPCWYAVRTGKAAGWIGKRKQATVWPIEVPLHRCQNCGALSAEETIDALPSTVWDVDPKDGTGLTVHGTQKPVECMARPMRNHAAPSIYDPFVGSGTSIIAAEILKRAVFAIDVDPTYVQLTIDRWEAFTGQKAVRI